MRAWLILAAVLAAAPAFAGEGKAPPPVEPIPGPPTPFSDMVIDVQRLQARMAQGDKAAYAESRERMKTIGQAIYAAGPEAFKVADERAAVVVYLLSGGQPRDVAKIVERGDFPAEERDLLRGAIGYVGGRQAQAEALLPFDAGHANLRLAGQLAYAQSVLTTPKDPHKALALLDLARLEAPGTLVEEAALRREILLVGDLHETTRVAFLARQYVERFGKSLYASDFVQNLVKTTIRSDLCSTLPDLQKFSALLALTPPEQSRAFLLAVSRASLPLGRFEVAATAADDAMKTAPPGSPDEARARLYGVAARLHKLPEVDAISALAGAAEDKLEPGDRALLKAATFVHGWLHEPPPNAFYDDVWREAEVAAARSPSLQRDADPVTTTIGRADAAVAAAEALGKDPVK